ncbi:hypothetical protein [Streptomyces sp. NPDC013455]|uniref:hypothetical protein n=1 Tax=Streptomyces sp. NPDC013455 TaxID=3155605 RepID=UPI0033C4C0F5
MATWQRFIEVLTDAFGTENVSVGRDGTKVSATMDVPAEEGSTQKRRQKVLFESDGKNMGWVAATSFIAAAEGLNISALLEQLGEEWRRPGAVNIGGQLALRHHFSLIPYSDDSTENTKEQLLKIAIGSAMVVGILADRFEEGLAEKDVR